MAKIYIAGPLFNTHERWYLERITEALEETADTLTDLPTALWKTGKQANRCQRCGKRTEALRKGGETASKPA